MKSQTAFTNLTRAMKEFKPMTPPIFPFEVKFSATDTDGEVKAVCLNQREVNREIRAFGIDRLLYIQENHHANMVETDENDLGYKRI